MSGALNQLRQHADAIRAANMKADGMTARAIADALNKKPEQVKKLVLLGERLKRERTA